VTPNPILRAAITASGHSSRGFAEDLLRVDERTVRRYLRGDWPVPGPVAQLCRAILRDETLAAWLAPAKAIARVASNAAPRRLIADRDFLSLRIRPISRKNAG